MKSMVMVSSYSPRFCGIATFVEEALEFIKSADPKLKIDIISHTDGEGENVHPIIDLSKKDWYKPVAAKIKELNPDVVHFEHEYGLYNYINKDGEGDGNKGFLKLLSMIEEFPVMLEMHTVHGRLKESEEEFIRGALERCSVLILKCEYQKWRLAWNMRDLEKGLLDKVAVVPHGARADRRYGDHEIDGLKKELGLGDLVGKHLAGLVGWIQPNKGWNLVIDMWEEIHDTVHSKTGEDLLLFAAGDVRDPEHVQTYEKYREGIKGLYEKGLAKYYKFSPRGDVYYKVMAICDFVMLPSIDETQSGTLARIIALNKPYVTTAPLEGLTSQTLESDGGLLFTDKSSLRRSIIRLATSEPLRRRLGNNLKWYLDTKVSWEIVANSYFLIYEKAITAKKENRSVYFPPSF